MKGLILAGGAGTRLRPITHTSAKQLVPVANKPILFYGLEHMIDAGIREFGIVVGDTANEIKAAVGDGSRWGVQVTYIQQDAPLGLGHCVLIAKDFLGDDNFIVYLGDNMIQQGVATFLEHFENECRIADTPTLDGQRHAPPRRSCCVPVPDPQRFGVAEVDEQGHVVRLIEKPDDPPSNLALAGVYLFTPAIHEAVRAIAPSPRGELEITDAIQWLIDDGQRVLHEVLVGWWLDTGKKDPLLESNRRVLETIEPRLDGKIDDDSPCGWTRRDRRGRGARLGRTCAVRPSSARGRAWSTRMSARSPRWRATARSSIQRSSTPWCSSTPASSACPASPTHWSVAHVEITRTQQRPAATRVMVGDHCSIDLE